MDDVFNELTTLPNIGEVLAENLIKIEISSSEEFINLGAEKAFIRIIAINKATCLQQLYALDGAVKNIRWHNLPMERKIELKHFYNNL